MVRYVRRYPLYREITLASLVVNGARRELSAWVETNPTAAPPTVRWPLDAFFSSHSADGADAEPPALRGGWHTGRRSAAVVQADGGDASK